MSEWLLARAAETVVWDADNTDATDPWGRGRASGSMAVWQSLTELHDRAEALAYARVIAASTDLTAVTPPF